MKKYLILNKNDIIYMKQLFEKGWDSWCDKKKGI